MRVYFTRADFGSYEMFPVNKRIAAKFLKDTGHESVLIQTDWDYPGIATSLGWVNKTRKHDCYHDTDGTVDCSCGRTASDMIGEAEEFLDKCCDRVFRGKLDSYFGVL